jgi:malate dehydrogenase (oxaloacetate-decarboxylating)(NADP+)
MFSINRDGGLAYTGRFAADLSMSDDKSRQAAREAALRYHAEPRPGKLEIRATKPLANGIDLARAYSPGVAEACLEIKADPSAARDYTARGNLVAVVSNGSAVLGLGNIGALAAKPVMEGKAVLFKKFAGIDCFDIELDEQDPERLADIVCALEPSFGAINLEDIKAPDCFIVEKRCRERMRIPVFHDDQHGTAIVVGAAATNALHLAGKRFEDIKLVSTGGGAAGIACLNMLLKLGLKRENIWLCDLHGLVFEGREVDMNPQKAAFAQPGGARELGDVIDGADLFLGLSGPGADAGDGGAHGGTSDRVCPGQPGAGDSSGPGARGGTAGDYRHGALRLPEPGQQCTVLSRLSSAVPWTSAPRRSTTRCSWPASMASRPCPGDHERRGGGGLPR